MFLKTLWNQRRNTGTKTDIEDSISIESGGEPGEKDGLEDAGKITAPGEKGIPGPKGNNGRDGEKKRMNDLNQAVDTFIEAILASETYRTYQAELEKVKQDPELKKQIDEFRKRNFELQLSQDADYERLDHFEKEYESFREQPLVADFLAAELDLCRKMQEISMRVVEALNFE